MTFSFFHLDPSPHPNPIQHLSKLHYLQGLMHGIPKTYVLSTSYKSCVIVADTASLALEASDVLLAEGIISKTIKGHFNHVYYIQVRYA